MQNNSKYAKDMEKKCKKYEYAPGTLLIPRCDIAPQGCYQGCYILLNRQRDPRFQMVPRTFNASCAGVRVRILVEPRRDHLFQKHFLKHINKVQDN